MNIYSIISRSMIPKIQAYFATGILFSICFTMQTKGQTPIALQAAIDTAIRNNSILRNEKLKAEYLHTLIKTGNNLPMTTAGIEYGQINSSYADTRFGLGQSLNFPTVYSRQKSVLKSEWRSGLLQIEARQALLKKQVTEIYYSLYYLMEKEKLLKRNDSFYSEFLKKSELKFNAGESNLMEKITAETQQGQIRIQLNQLKNDQAIVQIQFRYLLNTVVTYSPSETGFRIRSIVTKDSAVLGAHPSIQLLEQEKIISNQNTALQKSRLLPDLTLSYSNMSMKGVGSDNVYYTTSTRFQSAQIGVGIPLFFGAQKSRINASVINEQIATNNYTIGLNTLKNDYQSAVLQYEKYTQTVDYFEQTALKNASTILTTAGQQFNNGAISYMEYVLLTNQAIAIQNDYIDAVRNLNESLIAVTYFTNP